MVLLWRGYIKCDIWIDCKTGKTELKTRYKKNLALIKRVSEGRCARHTAFTSSFFFGGDLPNPRTFLPCKLSIDQLPGTFHPSSRSFSNFLYILTLTFLSKIYKENKYSDTILKNKYTTVVQRNKMIAKDSLMLANMLTIFGSLTQAR